MDLLLLLLSVFATATVVQSEPLYLYAAAIRGQSLTLNCTNTTARIQQNSAYFWLTPDNQMLSGDPAAKLPENFEWIRSNNSLYIKKADESLIGLFKCIQMKIGGATEELSRTKIAYVIEYKNYGLSFLYAFLAVLLFVILCAIVLATVFLRHRADKPDETFEMRVTKMVDKAKAMKNVRRSTNQEDKQNATYNNPALEQQTSPGSSSQNA